MQIHDWYWNRVAMNIGIIGGTGPAGQSLALRLATNGNRVLVGSRDDQRSRTVIEALLEQWPGRSLDMVHGTNLNAAECEIAVLATPWEGSVSTAVSLAGALRGKVLISMVNALARVGGEFQALLLSRGSVAASLQSELREVMVTTAFQHIPARELGLIDDAIAADVLVCSDGQLGFDRTAEVVSSIEGLRPVYGGSLASATAVEAFTAVLLNVNIRYKAHASLRLTGLEEDR